MEKICGLCKYRGFILDDEELFLHPCYNSKSLKYHKDVKFEETCPFFEKHPLTKS